jgi:hypothetical protein
MIDASQRMIRMNTQGGAEPKDGGGVNPVIERHYELQIENLQNAPRDVDNLEEL